MSENGSKRVTCMPENCGCWPEKEACSMSDTSPRTERAPASAAPDPASAAGLVPPVRGVRQQ